MFGGTQRQRPAIAATAALSLIVVLVSGGSGAGAEARRGGLDLRQLANFNQPVHIDDAPGFRNLLFVVEKPGRIGVMRNEDKLGHDFLDIHERVRTAGSEEGLLSIAFAPGYERNRRFYVYYTNNDGDIQVDRFKRSKRSNTRALEGTRRKIIVVQHNQADNHNGGQLQIGPDGHLYLGPGDGGTQEDPENDAQSKSSLLGKILRIDPKRKGGYRVPQSNPYVGEAGQNEVYARGFRNPWRFTFDRETGALLVGDVGGGLREELDYTPAGAARGANFGWHNYEGKLHRRGSTLPNRIVPVLDYPHSGGVCAVTGGYVVRSASLPDLEGRYVYADYCVGEIRSFPPGNPNADSSTGLDTSELSSFGEGRNGRVYVTSLNGPVFRIVQN